MTAAQSLSLQTLLKQIIGSTSGGDPCVVICGDITTTFSGLSTDWKTTTISIGTSELALPLSSLTGRNSVTIHNTSNSKTLFLGPTGVTADSVVGTTSGLEIPPDGRLQIDITNAIPVFAIAASGTVIVKITEYA